MMDENKDSTKDVESGDEAETPELSLEELDQTFQQEDSEFVSQMEGMRAEKLAITGDDSELHRHDSIWDRIKNFFSAMGQQFLRWSFFQKLTFLLILISLPALGFYFSYVFKKGYIHPSNQVFVNSMAEWADQTYEWNSTVLAEKEAFYGSLRLPLYVYNMKKLIVNLKTSNNAPSNSMIAIELVAEGTTPEVVSELKENESFYRDLFQQELSQMSYEGIAEGDGKFRMLERLRRVINENVNKGKIKKLYFKNLILKK